MAASKKKRTGTRAAAVVVLCLVLVCVVAAAVALGLVSRRVKSFAGGASFSLDYQITSTAAEEPALYKVLAQFGGTSGRVDGQYTPEALQLELYPQASGSSQPLTRLYISKDETLYDAGQLYPAQQHHRQLSAGRCADPGMEYGQLHLPDPAGQPAGRG